MTRATMLLMILFSIPFSACDPGDGAGMSASEEMRASSAEVLEALEDANARRQVIKYKDSDGNKIKIVIYTNDGISSPTGGGEVDEMVFALNSSSQLQELESGLVDRGVKVVDAFLDGDTDVVIMTVSDPDEETDTGGDAEF